MKPKIAFLQLTHNSLNQANELYNIICELCYTYSKDKRNVYVLCPNTEFLYQLDEYTINYQIGHFFPYNLLGQGPIPPAPICFGDITTNKLKYDILINLHSIIPDNFIKYREIIEFVANEHNDRSIARAHYTHYRKFALPVEFNTLNLEPT